MRIRRWQAASFNLAASFHLEVHRVLRQAANRRRRLRRRWPARHRHADAKLHSLLPRQEPLPVGLAAPPRDEAGLDSMLGRPVKFADLNGDGRLDLVGALIHNDGNLPKTKLRCFGWRTTAARLRRGKSRDQVLRRCEHARPVDRREMDHLIPLDVDGDGDIDLLGNVENITTAADGKDVSGSAWSGLRIHGSELRV